MNSVSFIISLILIIGLSGCSDPGGTGTKENDVNPLPDKKPKLFSLLSQGISGFSFTNSINETEQNNYLTYEYMYNGAGVAVGDINNDGLIDIFMVSNFGSNALFLNNGDLRFENITQSAGLTTTGLSTGASMADVNGDGLLDIYVCQSFTSIPDGRRNKLFINQGNNFFIDKAKEYGLDDPSFSNQACFFDYDLDGDLDMFLVNHRVDFSGALIVNKVEYLKLNESNSQFVKEIGYTSTKLFRNDGNRFVDVTEKAGVGGYNFSLSACVSDLDMDGDMDIYVANDFGDVDNYYTNNGDGTFTDELVLSFAHISKNSMGTDAADVNNDGLPDLISLDMLAEGNFRQKQLKGPSPYDKYYLAVDNGLHHQVMRNNLQINNGDGTFTEIGAMAGISHTDWSWAPLFVDFDCDGWKDLFVTNGYHRDVTDMDYIKYKSPDAIQASGGFENTNKLELLSSMPRHEIPNYIFRNDHSYRFINMSDSWGVDLHVNSQGAAVADLDNDGDQDLILNNLGSPAMIYENKITDAHPSHFIKIAATGYDKNRYGIGVKVWIEIDDNEQYAELIPSRGFMSSSEPVLHFGTGQDTMINKLTILWPDGKGQVIEDVKSDRTIRIDHKDAEYGTVTLPVSPADDRDLNLTKVAGLNSYTHKESKFNDFKTDPLIPHMLSNRGPFIEKGDLDGDGDDDIVISGSAGYNTRVFLQNTDGSFKEKVQPALQDDAAYEDSDITLLDADNDNDLDLYVPSGSSEFKHGAAELQDRFYLNDGKGNFSETEGMVPVEGEAGTCAIPLDYDRDGLTDIFVGATSSARSYPVSSRCLLLHNSGNGFKDMSSEILPGNGELGMINDAAYADVNGDGSMELIVAGEWSAIRVFSYDGNRFNEITSSLGLSRTSGWWNCIEVIDVDGDGDQDIIAGNRGMNSFYKASPETPASIYYADFDDNGSIDPFQFYHYNDGKLYPRHTLDETFSQMPSIRKRFLRYTPYAKATIDEFFTEEQKAMASVLTAEIFETSLFINENNSGFRHEPLPALSQSAPVNCIRAGDFNDDGKVEILMVGNNYGVDAETGRYDAMRGVYLAKKDSIDAFSFVPGRISGFNTQGDCREMIVLKRGMQRRNVIVVSTNRGPLQVFKVKDRSARRVN